MTMVTRQLVGYDPNTHRAAFEFYIHRIDGMMFYRSFPITKKTRTISTTMQ
jgi:hypothetical protein